MQELSDGGARRYIDSIAEHLFAPLLRPRPANAPWRVLSWDAEQGLCLTVQHGGAVLMFELEGLDPARDCYARSERFNIQVRRQFESRDLSRADRRLAKRIIAVIQSRENLLPAPERPASHRRVGLREVAVERVLIPEGRGQYYINPYVGCLIGCPFCYVAQRADLSRALEGLPAQPWGRYVDVKVNAARVLQKEVQHHQPGPVRMSPILTDPYQGPEGRYRITRSCLEVLLPAGFTPVILTRAARVTADIDILRRFVPPAVVGLSIPTDDDAMRAIFEPGADPIAARLDALAALHAAGIKAFCVIQPVLPMNEARLVDAIAPHCQAVRVDRIHFAAAIHHLYEENGLADAAGEAFYQRTRSRLLRLLAVRGIAVDEMDNLAAWCC